MSLKSIIETIRGIAEAHPQINSFRYGTINTDKKDKYYPEFFVEADNSNLNGTELNLVFNFIVSDRLMKGFDNELDVHSNTLAILLDVRAKLKNTKIATFSEFNLTPFTDTHVDEVAGWIMTGAVNTTDTFDNCAIPN